MTAADLSAFFAECAAAGVRTTGPDHVALAPACVTEIVDNSQWNRAV